MTNSRPQGEKTSFLAKFLAGTIGVVAGAVAGVLFAPKSGKETRADIASLWNQGLDEVMKRAEQVQNITQDKYNDIVDTVSKGYEKTLGHPQVQKMIADLKAKWPEVKAKLANMGNAPEEFKVSKSSKDKRPLP